MPLSRRKWIWDSDINPFIVEILNMIVVVQYSSLDVIIIPSTKWLKRIYALTILVYDKNQYIRLLRFWWWAKCIIEWWRAFYFFSLPFIHPFMRPLRPEGSHLYSANLVVLAGYRISWWVWAAGTSARPPLAFDGVIYWQFICQYIDIGLSSPASTAHDFSGCWRHIMLYSHHKRRRIELQFFHAFPPRPAP